MNNKLAVRAALIFVVWLSLALGASFALGQKISNLLGPDSWWMLGGWLGAIVGLIHVLIMSIGARQKA